MVMHVFISTLKLADSLSLRSTSKFSDSTACNASDTSSSGDGEGGSGVAVAVGVMNWMEVISDGSIK